MQMNLIDQIVEAIESEDVDRYRESDRLQYYYRNAPKDVKENIDKFSIMLCGYSIDTLIDKQEPIADGDL